ncbi:hypothetical protein C0J52_23761 [Blattella germanica]|nr:hypothetical protein C0J52_23761 [Blattella germanica]
MDRFSACAPGAGPAPHLLRRSVCPRARCGQVASLGLLCAATSQRVSTLTRDTGRRSAKAEWGDFRPGHLRLI